MLQRQILFKQLQEMQQRQQLEELGNNRNQNYVQQLSSLKQASGGQFSPTVNEPPVQDSSRMFTFGSTHIQHNGPSGLFLSQYHNLAPQFGVSSYGIHAPKADENLNQYSHLQGPSNLSVDMLTKNQSTSDRSFMSQRYNFSSNQMPDGSLISNQDSGFLSGNYPQQGFAMQKNAFFPNSERRDGNAAALDPLEQKILYNTDDNNWESAFSRISKMNSGGFGKTVEMSSIQSGSWSALMQSAVAESSVVQEEWSGLSFQNPEPLNDGKKLQNDRIDRNLQHALSPSSNPDNMVQNINSFTNIQQSDQHLKHKEEYQPTGGSQLIQESLPSPNMWPDEHKEYPNSDTHPFSNFSCTNNNQPRINFSGQEFSGPFWPQGRTSDHVSGIQKKYNQVNQQNNHGYSIEPETMALVGVSNGENVTAPSEGMSELLNKDDKTSNSQTSAMQLSSKASVARNLLNTFPVSPDFRFRQGPTDPQIPQSYSSFPSLSMGNSIATPPSNHIVRDHSKTQQSAPPVQSHLDTEYPAYSATASHEDSEKEVTNSSVLKFPLLENLPESQPSLTPDMLQHEGFQMGLPTAWPENQNSFQHDAPTGINNSASLSRNIHEEESAKKHRLEENADESGTSITNLHEQASNQAEIKKETTCFPARDIGAFRHSSNHDYSPLHQVISTRFDETDGVKGFPPEIKNVSNHHSVANARTLLLSGLQSQVKGRVESDSHAFSQAFWSGKASSTSYNQNSENNTPNHSTSYKDTSNLTYQSHISSQIAPSWFKHYETLKNGHILPVYDASAVNNAGQLVSEMILGKLQENNLVTQVNLANASQGSGVCPSTVVTSIARKELNPSFLLSSDVLCQNLAVSIAKKRKLAALDMVPWHKEGKHEQLGIQDISTAEYLWAEASNRKQEEANNEAGTVEEMLPVIRAKRRLVSTTQLMQQVFRPAPAIVLCLDASPNYDCVVYIAARLALGDASNLTGQLVSDTNNMSPDELKNSKRTKACDFSKVVEAFLDRVKKIEADLSRVDKSLSIVDIKVEAGELEKFSTINRFAKFHVRAHPVNVDPASSSTTTLLKANLQRYVVPLPMPKIVPEGPECLSL